MNLVAHQYLSFNHEELQIGNLLGEVVKGNRYNNFSKNIKGGILLHRFIDNYTDSHKIVKNSSSYFHETQHKFSPIIVDVIYDYYLIKHWDKFSNLSFDLFKNNCYLLFQEKMPFLPIQLQKTVSYILTYDWFKNYSSLEGVAKTLKGIGERTKFENNLHQAISSIEKNYTNLEHDFLIFFPELIKHCKFFISEQVSIKI